MKLMSTFDPRDLDRLATEVSHWPFMRSFAQKYRRLLPQRVNRIVTATERGELDQALDATLSLRVASTIVGALELVDMASCIEARLRSGDGVGAHAHARLLADAADRVDHALSSYLVACRDC